VTDGLLSALLAGGSCIPTLRVCASSNSCQLSGDILAVVGERAGFMYVF
jgi:hypothetical protein